MGFLILSRALELAARQDSDPEDPDKPEAGLKEIYTSWAMIILILLLILAFFTSHVLQSKKIQAVHETVIGIFTGMVIGLILRLTAVSSVTDAVTFNYQLFFNLLLPPIILASGYELHQVRGRVHSRGPQCMACLTSDIRVTSSATWALS